MSSRGRPRNADNPTVRDKDAVIARSAAILIAWGFARRTVYAELAPLARELLGRTDHEDKTLSAERIEQIHEEWRKFYDKDDQDFWDSSEFWDDPDFSRFVTRSSFTKKSLQAQTPSIRKEVDTENLTFSSDLSDLASALLRNKGQLPKTKHSEYIDPLTDETVVRYVEDIAGFADPEPTPKALADTAPIPRMRKRGR